MKRIAAVFAQVLSCTCALAQVPIYNYPAPFSSAQITFGSPPATDYWNTAATLRLRLHGIDNPTSSIEQVRWSANANSAENMIGKSRGAAIGTRGAVVLNDEVGRLSFMADDGGVSFFARTASIVSKVDGAPSAGIVPGRIEIATANASGVTTTALTINSSQQVTGMTAVSPTFVTPVLGAATGTSLSLAGNLESTGGSLWVRSNTATNGLVAGTALDAWITRSAAGVWNVGTTSGATTGTIVATTHTVASGGSLTLASKAAINTAPTIASGLCTSPAVAASNGSASFSLTVGTSCAGVTTGTLTMPAATTRYACSFANLSRSASIRQTAGTTTSVTFTNYDPTTGLAADVTAGDTIVGMCLAH